MTTAAGSAPKKSRVTVGFHRLGVVLVVLLVLGGLGTAISAWFSDNGPVIADPVETMLPSTVVFPRERELIRERIRTKSLESIATYEMDTGPIRTFGPYPTRIGQTVNEQTGLDVLTQITAFERRRGAVVSA